MIILLEGPDGTGKTTLAQGLCLRYGLEYHHEGPPPRDASVLEHYGKLLQDARGKNVVFDRFAWGERVYGPLLRQEDRLGADGWRNVLRLIRAAGAVQVLCYTEYQVARDAWKRKAHQGRELFQDEELFSKVYQTWANAPCDVVFDYRRDSFSKVIDEVAQSSKIEAPHVIGSPTARYLLIGERGSNLLSELDLPFFGTTHSAEYLNRALDLAGFVEEEIAFMNAYPIRSVIPNPIPRYDRVIALGEKASIACELQSVKHEGVPHPAFWRRFHHHDVESYANMLRSCRL